MENNGKLLVLKSSMASPLHYNEREHKLPGSNLRAISDNVRSNRSNYFKTFVNWIKTLNKKMAEMKLGWILLAHILGTGVYGYALYIEWGTVKGVILTVLGIMYAIVQVARFVIKGLKELYEFKKQLKDFNKPTEQPPVHKHTKHG